MRELCFDSGGAPFLHVLRGYCYLSTWQGAAHEALGRAGGLALAHCKGDAGGSGGVLRPGQQNADEPVQNHR